MIVYRRVATPTVVPGVCLLWLAATVTAQERIPVPEAERQINALITSIRQRLPGDFVLDEKTVFVGTGDAEIVGERVREWKMKKHFPESPVGADPDKDVTEKQRLWRVANGIREAWAGQDGTFYSYHLSVLYRSLREIKERGYAKRDELMEMQQGVEDWKKRSDHLKSLLAQANDPARRELVMERILAMWFTERVFGPPGREAKIQLFAQCVGNLKKIDELYLGVPTVVEVVFDEPQDKDQWTIEIETGSRKVRVPADRDPDDFRRFVSDPFLPGQDARQLGPVPESNNDPAQDPRWIEK